MNETLFVGCNSLALIGWVLLVFAPAIRLTTTLIASVAIPTLLAAVYVALIAANLGSLNGGFGNLAAVGELFDNQSVLLAGWVHYLAFDLFVGTWQVRDARRIGISHLLVIPCLILTFLLGPIGMLAYFILRLVTKRQWLIADAGVETGPLC